MPEARIATVDDADAIAAVHVQAWQEAYDRVLPDQLLKSLSVPSRANYWRGALLQGLDRSRTRVIGDGEGIVGFVSVSPARDVDVDQNATGEILAIYVLARGWGEGYGKELMVAGLDDLREFGFSEAVLWVVRSNRRGREFYEQGGWRTDGVDKIERWEDTVIDELRYRLAL